MAEPRLGSLGRGSAPINSVKEEATLPYNLTPKWHLGLGGSFSGHGAVRTRKKTQGVAVRSEPARGSPRTRAAGQGGRRVRTPPPAGPRSDVPNLFPSGHLGVLSLPKGLCYPLPQVSAQVPAPFGLVHWPFLTELKETTVAESGHLGPRLPRPWGRSQGAEGACAPRRTGLPGGHAQFRRRPCCPPGSGAAHL